MKNGTAWTGIAKGESGDTLTLAIGPGVNQTLARGDVAEMQPGSISLMPQGFDQILSRQELADLVTFLKASVRKPN
jgi:putative heme-binding domain-containing protein